jgi:hypothetical protein
MVNRETTCGYWDHPLHFIEDGELDLRFLQFFDWWDLGFRDFEHYRVRIVGSERHPSLIGRDALVPVGSAIKVLHDPSGLGPAGGG